MNSADPISQQREYVMGSKTIKLTDDYLYFGSTKLRLTQQTAWEQKGLGSERKRYNIGDLWLLLNTIEIKKGSRNEYYSNVSQFQGKGVNMISVNHQKEIQDYFTGRIDYSEAINDDLRENTREKQYLAKRKKPEGLIEKKEKIEGENDGDEEYKKYLEQIRKWERVLETKNGKMRRNKSFFWCLELLEARQKNKTTGGNSDQLRNQTLQEEILNLPTNDLDEAKPIIQVPNYVIQGNLNQLNVKRFLITGEYRPVQGGQSSLEKNCMEFSHDINDQRVQFEVYDDVMQLKQSKKLDRVVAIFLNDNRYQFKDSQKIWGEANIAKLLTKVRGYYMAFSDVPINEQIKKLNIKVLHISRNQRHKDLLVKREFWEDISKFLTKYRGK